MVVETQPLPPAQPAFSFMGMVKKTAELPKSSRSKRIDPLTLAKQKIIEALKTQRSYVALVVEDKPLPKKGERETSTWFSKQTDGWWTSIRYGQQSIKIDGNPDFFIGKLEDVAAFYDAVTKAIEAGELDAQIGKLQTERSAKLTGSH
jgi:hypothetical protein